MGAQFEMSGCGPSVLRTVYWRVLGIRDYVHVLQTGGEQRVSLQQEGDPASYKSFLSELLVCIPPQAKKLAVPVSFLQLSTQSEVVARVIQRICEKNKKNVLAFGYGLVAEKSSLCIKFAPNICNYFPNPTTATISSSALWETLLSRVGDDVMMHLLENCSLFMKVPPNCCYQMCGQPIYNVTKEETFPSPWVKQNTSIYKGSVLCQYTRTHSFTSKRRSLKMNTLRKRRKSQRNVKAEAPMEAVEAEVIQSSNALKRPPHIDLCNISAKRRKPEVRLADTHTSTVTTVELGVCSGGRWDPNRRSVQEETLDATAGDLIVNDFVESDNEVPSCSSTSTEKTSPSNILIDFGKVLGTNPVSAEGFSQRFVLNLLESSSRGSLSLIERIFMNNNVFEEDSDLQVLAEGKRKKKVSKRYWQLVPIFQELIKNHKLCPYRSLLKKHCPVRIAGTEVIRRATNDDGTSEHSRCHTTPAASKANDPIVQSLSFTETTTNQSRASTEKRSPFPVDEAYILLKQHSSDWKVYTFVRECLHIVVPEHLWGSSRNKCRFLRNVKMIIKSTKCEKMSLSELMCKMKVEDCSWLRLNKRHHFVPASEHLLREKIFSKFLFWLLDTYIMELLKAFYYITVVSFQKNRLFFYRRSIWEELQKIGIRKHMTKVKLRLMSTDEMENVQQQKTPPFVSRLRFIPKRNGLRPIVKMCNAGAQQSNEVKQRNIQHFNTQVRNLSSVLNYESKKFPNLVGSSVFGLDGIYEKWKKYVLKLKDANPENVHFYFVKTDIREAYDTIPHAKLEEVISRVLRPAEEEVYCIRCYAALWMDSRGRIRKSFKRHVSNLDHFMPNMQSFLTHFQEQNLVQNAVLVEQSLSLKENSSKLLAFFQQIIFNHILKINDRYYMQCCGIPQGSVLSALLCSLCYGDMENKLLYGIGENGVFMRLIDDFLLVTPHLEQAKRFLRLLADGVPEYGCSISLRKTVVNFPVDDIPALSTVQRLPNRSLFRWCGLLLDTKTLEVFCDYSSFSCTSVRSSLSFCHSSKAGENMRDKLLNILRLKCHGLFLDLQINSLRTVHINAYKILLLQAYRFHACVVQLPIDQSIKNNPSFFLRVISDMASSFYVILRETNKDFPLGSRDAGGPFPYESAQWLNYHAFITKMSDHSLLYKRLLVPLQKCKTQLSGSVPDETLGILKEVTAPSLHREFSTTTD